MANEKRRSKLEERFEKLLQDNGAEYSYETVKVPYIIPESNHKYIVDFTTKNNIQWELKGYLSDYAERRKYILVKEQNPDIDLRFVFDNPNKLVGGAKMTHSAWAVKYGFTYCGIKDTDTILKWINE